VIQKGAFDGTPIKVIILNRNKLSSLPDLSSVAETLELLGLNNNPLKKEEIQRLQQMLPNTKITQGPITRQALIAIGVTVTVILLAVAAVFGVKKYQAEQEGLAAAKAQSAAAEAAAAASPEGQQKKQLAEQEQKAAMLKKEQEGQEKKRQAAEFKKGYELAQGKAIVALAKGDYNEFYNKKKEAIEAFKEYYKTLGMSLSGYYLP
jgi:hypothetical protein